MTADEFTLSRSPFDVLSSYEQQSLAHDPGAPEEVEAAGVWRGVGFRIGERRFLCGIKSIAELLLIPDVTPVPGSQPWVVGMANLRGNLAAVIDLNRYLHAKATQLTNRSRALLVEHPGAALGLLVDEVLGQRSVAGDRMAELDEEQDEALRPYVAGSIQLDGQQWTIFNVDDLVAASQFQQAAA